MNNIKALTHQTFAGLVAVTVGFSATATMATPIHRQIITQGPHGADKIVHVAATQSQVFHQLSPFSLAHMAYQGWFKREDVPAAGRLIRDYRIGEITALDIAEAAVKTNRLSAETLQDSHYLVSLDHQLKGISKGD